MILLLLFCPFKYNINCAKKEGITAKVGVFWLFHFLSVRVVYDKTLLILARVLGIKVFKKTMLEKSSEKKKDDKSDEVKDFDYFDDLEDIEKAEEIQDDIEISEKASKKISMADISTFEEGVNAKLLGADIISTTLAGYTMESLPSSEEPAFDLLKRLYDELKSPIILEGRIWTPDQVDKAFELGAYSVVIGGAITKPISITKRFVKRG